jgi:hypothetical protein
VTTWCVFTVADGCVTGVARYEAAEDIPPPG